MNIGIASESAPNMKINGDSYLIRNLDHQILLAVIDGLGHGEQAFNASNKAKNFIDRNIRKDIRQIILDLDKYLINTRGIVIGIVKLDLQKKTIFCCGIGNIEINVISEPPIYPISQEGVVGSGLNNDVCQRKYEYKNIKLIMLHSDGISNKFELSDYPLIYQQPQETADDIIKNFRKSYDDATIMIITFDDE